MQRFRNRLARRSIRNRETPERVFPAPFVVGVGRSGTTMLRLMLDAHPELAIPPETHFITKVSKACGKSSEPRRTFVETVTSHRRWGDFGFGEEELRKGVYSLDPFDVSEALRVFYRLYAKRFDKPRWGDKTPSYVQRMERVQQLLPEARFVHVIRDGRDVALSNKGLWFGPDSAEETAGWWRDWILKAREQSRSLEHYLEVRYEDLILDTEKTLKRICEFIDLEWNPAMLEYHKTAEERLKELDRDIPPSGGKDGVRGENRTGIHALTNKPPQKNRIERWKNEMEEPDRVRFEEIAGDMLKEFGYRVG